MTQWGRRSLSVCGNAERMKALIIFGADNDHPLGFLLNREHRHVLCAVKTNGYWVVYNWHQGNPLINVVDGTFDLATHYRIAGMEVVQTEVGDEPCHGPWMCNNCVGHAMVICGIRTHFIFTPHQLWKHITGRTMKNSIRKLFNTLCFLPGFGGGKTTFLPAPTTTAPASQTTVDADAKLSAEEAARVKARKTAAGSTASASSTLLDDDSSGTGALK
jgi:hypothetical protein